MHCLLAFGSLSFSISSESHSLRKATNFISNLSINLNLLALNRDSYLDVAISSSFEN